MPSNCFSIADGPHGPEEWRRLRRECEYSVPELCEALQLSRGGFYSWQKRKASPLALKRFMERQF